MLLVLLLIAAAWLVDPVRVVGGKEGRIVMAGHFPLCADSGAATACISDGDSLRLAGGVPLRIVGLDAPEIGRPGCAAERDLAIAARAELQRLVNAGPFEIHFDGERDRYGRRLGRLSRGGEDFADRLIAKGLARPYRGGRRAGWC